VASALACAFSTGLDSFGTGLVVPLAGSAAFASGRGVALGAGDLSVAGVSTPLAALAGSTTEGVAGVSTPLAALAGSTSCFSVVEPAEPLGEAVSRPGDPFGDAAGGEAGAGAGEGVGDGAVAGVVRLSDARAAGAAVSPPGGEPLKYATQTGSTLLGSRWYWSYISSTSHSLAPRSAEGTVEDPEGWDWLPEGCGTAGFASSSDACE
jgi:hypothetical protein